MTIIHLYKDHNRDSEFVELKSRLESLYHNVVLDDGADLDDFSNVHLVHAHSWYDDGVAAFNLKRERGIPYVLTLSDKDLMQLQKFSFRSKRFDVLEQAEKVVFPNQMFQNVLADKMNDRMADAVFSHSCVIYEGLAPFWFNNLKIQQCVNTYRNVILCNN